MLDKRQVVELGYQMDELIATTIKFIENEGKVSEKAIQATWLDMHAELLASKITQ